LLWLSVNIVETIKHANFFISTNLKIHNRGTKNELRSIYCKYYFENAIFYDYELQKSVNFFDR
jgi:hypothetical protein